MYKASEELRSIQLRCVEILEYVDSFCRKHQIDYALCAGSAIGAYMYKGFIPWDDDVDLMMTRPNYNKFLKLWQKEKHPYELSYFANDPKTATMFAKIMDPNSTIIEKYDGLEEIVTGVFLDLTVIDDSCGKIGTVLKRKIARFCWLMNLSANNLVNDKKIDLWGKLPFGIRKRINAFADRIIQFRVKSTGLVQEYFAMDGDCDQTKYPKELFTEYIDAEFENRKFRILKENYEYLKIAFNRDDFHLPEDQQIPHHFAFVDINLPYKEYIKNHNR